MGRPKMDVAEKKVKETIYLPPDVHAWLTTKAGKREAALGSLLTIICRKEMAKESTTK